MDYLLDNNQIISHLFIVIGVIILCISLVPATRIAAEMPVGIIRKRWRVLWLLIVLFIVGYLAYAIVVIQEGNTHDLIVGVIFLFGALFVLFVCQLTLKTVKDLKQLDILQAENITDELTGMHNRRHLERCLEKEIVRAKNYNLPLSILMLDLDHYKKINDLHGHQVGDQILKCVGNLLKQATRRMDIVARYGGDEITVVLPNTDESTAWSIADRIRSLVEERSRIFHDDACKTRDIGCTVSIGVATFANNIANAHQLLLRADAALYHAKQSGRNRVVMHNINMTEMPTEG